RRHTRFSRDWSSDVCSSDLGGTPHEELLAGGVVAVGSPASFSDQPYLRRLTRLGVILARRTRVPQRWVTRMIAPFMGFFDLPFSELAVKPKSMDGRVVRRLQAWAFEDISAGVMRQFHDWVVNDVFRSLDGGVDYHDRMRAFRSPVLLVAATEDRLAPPACVERAFRLLGSEDRTLRVVGRAHGNRADYGHGDLLLGKAAPDEIYPMIEAWLADRATPVEVPQEIRGTARWARRCRGRRNDGPPVRRRPATAVGPRSKRLTCGQGAQHVGDDVGGAQAILEARVAAGDEADATRPHGGDRHAALAPARDERFRRPTGQAGEDHVGLCRLDLDAGQGGEGLGEGAGLHVVVADLGQVVVEGVEAGGGEDARLAQPAAEPSPQPPEGSFQVARAAEEGAGWRAQPLGEADAHRGRAGGEAGWGHAGGGGGVPEARAVEVDRDAVPPSDRVDRVEALEGPDRAPAAIVGVLHADQAGERDVIGDLQLDGGLDLLGSEDAALARQHPGLDAPEGRHGTALVGDHVGTGLADRLLAGTRQRADGDLVGHGSAGDEDGDLLAEEIRHALLEG